MPTQPKMLSWVLWIETKTFIYSVNLYSSLLPKWFEIACSKKTCKKEEEKEEEDKKEKKKKSKEWREEKKEKKNLRTTKMSTELENCGQVEEE